MKNFMIFLSVSLFLGFASLAFAQLPTQEVSIIAKQFAFYPAQIVVRKGQPLRLYLTSTDVTHGFALPAYKIDQPIKKGELATVDFVPDKAGTFPFHCSVFCGLGHLGMMGRLIVVE